MTAAQQPGSVTAAQQPGSMTAADAPLRIATVIVTYNSSAVLAECLAGLEAVRNDVDLMAVVIADNDSSDDSVAVATGSSGLPVIVVQTGRNAGYGAAINAGVRSLELDLVDAILVLNADVKLRPGALRELCTGLDRPGVGIVVPRLVSPAGELQYSLRRAPTIARALGESTLGGLRSGHYQWLGEIVTQPAAYERPGTTSWATGAAMLISTGTWRAAGPFEETLLMYGEEVEYALRAGDVGRSTWYVPSAIAEHVGGESTISPFLWSMLTLNRIRVYRMRHGQVASMAYYGAVVLGEALRAARRRPTARAALLALLVPSRRPRDLPQRPSHRRVDGRPS